MSSLAIKIDENSIPRDDMANAMINRKLHKCVRQDNIEAFQSLVEQHLTEKLVTPSGNSLLHVAVSYGSDNITSYLARTFPSLITIQNSQKDTILHLAAREGKASHTIKSLVELNPSLIRKKNTKGNTPLHDAVITDNKEVAKLLVSSYPEVAYYNNNNGKSPLYLAVENGNKKKILDDLLKTEVSFPIKSEDGDAVPKGKSPVHAAIKQRNRDILEKIGKEKPELLRLTEEELGNSLHYASSIGFLEGVRFLLKKFHDGAYETNRQGDYPIHVACKSHSVDVVKEFLDIFPYPKEFLNKEGQNILHVAAKYGNGSVVRYILKQEQKLVAPLLNAIDEDGNTPLHLGAFYGRCTATFLLVRDNRVEHFIVNNRNWTPYELAEESSKRSEEKYIKTDEMGKEVDSHKMDTKEASPKDEITVLYCQMVITLSILFFNACPKKSRKEIFPVIQLPMSRAKEEIKSMVGNLLVVTVLVAGVTFAGAIQLPQLRDKDKSREFNCTYEKLLCGYLFLDVGALSTSLVGALILLWSNFSYPKFQIPAVKFSISMVCLAIVMMFGAFFVSVRIALLGSHGGLLTIIVEVVAVMFFIAQAFLVFPWIIPLEFNHVLLQFLLHCFNYSFFLMFIYSRWWLPKKLSDLKIRHQFSKIGGRDFGG
ncbi:PREDICTED: ankyrin repeat, PH and SEC7 domain containing protein secG-like isoform X3 [Populus euphratica]|uniref:Ankyrin repeat, PH and SEC7 domain containing protein secG-like isoform X3 n=1 Tax=Populus euphratica TaxID=75702 RepID=A0AAJ6UXT1_POPEU|nr:PREDICTED: ankyrin repeat, PH and SEC7 domain containing protein secG-like isoform X3 [Populus euphratica]